MPSPLGHSLASAFFYKMGQSGNWFLDWKRLLFLVFCGLSPDLDFIPGIFAGNINRYHHMFSHSFFGALIIALCLWSIYGIWRRIWKGKDLLLISSAVLSHVVMDYIGLDSSQPYGCALFYPFSDRFYISPWIIFQDIHRSTPAEFFFSANNLLAFWIELAFFAPLLLAASYRRPRKYWVWVIACLISLFVGIFYLRQTVISDTGIQFIRVFEK